MKSLLVSLLFLVSSFALAQEAPTAEEINTTIAIEFIEATIACKPSVYIDKDTGLEKTSYRLWLQQDTYNAIKASGKSIYYEQAPSMLCARDAANLIPLEGEGFATVPAALYKVDMAPVLKYIQDLK